MQTSKDPKKRGWSLSVASLINEKKEDQASERQQEPLEYAKPTSVYRKISASLIYPTVIEKASPSKEVKRLHKKEKPTPAETALVRRTIWEREVDVRLMNAEGELDYLSHLLDSVQLVSDCDYLQERIEEQQEMEAVVSSVPRCERESVLPLWDQKLSPYDESQDPFFVHLETFNNLCTRMADLEDHRLREETEQWKKSKEPLETRNAVFKKEIQRKAEERDRKLRQNTVLIDKRVVLKPKQVEPTTSESNEVTAGSETSVSSTELSDEMCDDSCISPSSSPEPLTQSAPSISPSPEPLIQPMLTSIPPSSLIQAVDELLQARTNKDVLGEYYGDVREYIWKLKGILNKVSGGESACQEAESILAILNQCSCQEVQAILRAEIVDNLIHKAAETSYKNVCVDMAAIIAELAIADSHFVSMILGSLYRQCPLLIPQKPESSSLSDRAFENRMKNYSMLVILFCSLCLYRSSKGTNSFNLYYVWYWINEFNKLALKQPFLEYSGMVEPLFSILGDELCHTYPKAFQKLVQFTKESIVPTLEQIDGKTTGYIYRLLSILDKWK